jgi:DNA-binding transcriptional regulator LsrR (DeoR family)
MTNELSVRAPDGERLRALLVVARLYHIHGVRQREIATRLDMSQARVSRALRQAEALGIVRTVVAVPDGLHPHLEDALERSYGLTEAHVVDTSEQDTDLPRALGEAAASHLGEAAAAGEVLGFTSWSRTLQEMAFALEALPRTGTRHVVEMLGDLGSPMFQHAAARSTQAMATALGAEPVFLRTPGVAATPELRNAALGDPYVQRALRLLDHVDVAFVGVGPADVHSQLRAGDGYFSPRQLADVRAAGAAGQLNQRFLDAAGASLATSLDDLVVGCTLEQIRTATRRVVVAGGPEKHRPIAAALKGGWIDVLVTDVATARFLTDEIPSQIPLAPAASGQ